MRSGKLAPIFRPKQFTTIVAILIIGAGIASGLFAAITNNAQKREYLIGRAQTVADTLSIADLQSLSGSEDDLSTLAYSRSRQQLEKVRTSNLDISYIRVYTIAQNRTVINVDAQPQNSEFYGPPGTKIPNPSNELRSALLESNPTHDGLMSDYSQQWVAGYAPVINPDTSAVVAAVGVFVPATSYYLNIALYALVPILLAAIPFAGILRDIKLQAKEHEIFHLKNQFISIASHELRSPLTGMLWGVTSLQRNEDKLTKPQRELLKDMYKSTESSLATVNEILDSSIFERGQAKQLQKDLIDVTAIASQVIATLNLGAKEHNISIKTADSWPEKAVVTGDVEALKRAFMNILSNAIKYSKPDTTVTFSYRLADKKEHVFCIADQGIGIPHDEQKKVLGGYYRATNANSVQAHGTGLGLWVSRMTIESHGGRIWLNSIEGRGTTVSIALPISKPVIDRQSDQSA